MQLFKIKVLSSHCMVQGPSWAADAYATGQASEISTTSSQVMET
jgi:hypothetical protein